MKVGISVNSSYPGIEARLGAQYMIERTVAAEQSALDSLFLGDHHSTPSNYYQNTPMLGRMLAEWGDRPAGALFLLPLWNPVLVAEQAATLACLARGRFILQCGLGSGERQFMAMGKQLRYRTSAFEQAIATMRRLWAGESASLDGRWRFSSAVINPLPPEPIAIWIGASAEVAIDRAARIGDGWLADPAMTLPQARQAIDFYRECQSRHNRSASTAAIRRDIYVAESARDARQARQIAAGYRGFNPEALIIGEAPEVTAQFQAFQALGYSDIIVRNLHPDQVKAVASIHRLAGVRSLLEQS